MPDWTRQSNSCRYWLPINWIFITCYRLKAKTLIGSDTLLNALLLEVRHYKDGLQKLCNYDWVSIECLYIRNSHSLFGRSQSHWPTHKWSSSQ